MKENSLQLLLNERKQISEDIYNSIRGLGVLQELIDDPQITEIMVNGPDIIFIEKKGRLLEYERCFEDEEDLMRIVKSIVENVNREINPSEPIADAHLDNDIFLKDDVFVKTSCHLFSLCYNNFGEKNESISLYI